MSLPQNLLSNPNLKPYLMNPNLLNSNLLNQLSNRINNRLPNTNSPMMNNIPNIPNGFIVDPSNRPSLPLHFPKPNQPSSTTNRPLSNLNPQFNALLLNQLLKPGTTSHPNLTSLSIQNLFNNMIANNQSFDHFLSPNLLNTSSSKNYIKVEQAEVSRLLLGLNGKPMRNEIVFGSTAPSSSINNDNSLNSIDSSLFPNELFHRASINRTLNENSISNTNLFNMNKSINPSKLAEIAHTTTPIDKIENLFELTNATVISNNHHSNRFKSNRTQLASSLSSSLSPIIQETISTVRLLDGNLLSNSIYQANSETTITSIWKPFDKFEIFNTNNDLIKPTRIWGNTPDIITKPEEVSTFDITVRNKLGANESRIQMISENSIKPTTVAGLHEASKEPEVVYGRPANQPGNAAADQPFGSVNPVNLSATQATINSFQSDHSNNQRSTPALSSATAIQDSVGRPQVYPVEMDLVKPQIGPSNNQLPTGSVSIITESGGGSVYIDAQQKHFKLKPIQKTSAIPSMQIGSTMNVYGNNGNIDARKPGSSLSNGNPINPFNSLNTTADKPIRSNLARRPIFRPKPATPLVRIDTCIVGDDSTCGSNLNEQCKTEAGISSCQCKPGFGRISQRGLCIPTTSLILSLKLDKLGDNKLQFSKNLLNSDSEEFQYLEFESIQAINSLFQNSRLNKLFLGVRVKFYPAASKTMLNATVVLERNNVTKSNSIKKQLQQELSRVISAKNNALGGSQLLVDSVALPRIDDLNECADQNLNDCSRNARCINELGTFSCVCKAGFQDRFEDRFSNSQSNSQHSSLSALTASNVNKNMKLGRICLGCSPTYCSNRGDCSIQNGEKTCHCKGNFMGSRCDLDAEVLAVAFGGSLAALIIIIITILCLYIWNQKWKNEQQKMEAMSSGSGQTFNYVNKPANTTTSFRFGMEERMRGFHPAGFETATLQNNASNYNYYVAPEQLLVSSSQHVYATPNREEIVQTPDQLLDDDSNQHFYNTRRSKSRNCSLAYTGIYNETEFSTRKALYTPSHLMMSTHIGTARPKYAMY